MSSLIIEVCRIDEVREHPNADKMAIARIKGWETCIVHDPATGKNQFEPGDRCVYVPPDSVLPLVLADRLNITKYLSSVRDVDGNVVGGRVRVARLRGQPSYGLLLTPDDPSWNVGADVAAFYGITKWEPPQDSTDGDRERAHPAFHSYFELENYRNFPGLLVEGEEVVFTEKIHGKNCRVGLIQTKDDKGEPVWTFMAGSHDVRRKEFCKINKRRTDPATGEEEVYQVEKRSQFWEALDKPGVKELLCGLSGGVSGETIETACRNNVVVFGEIYGSGVQEMAYGFVKGQWEFRVFDITVNGKYLDYAVKELFCRQHGVEMVPVLYRGPFSKEKVEEYVGGPTTLCPPGQAGKFKEREGIVITTTKERMIETEKKVFERTALKAINFAYLERKDGTEYH